MKETYLIVYDIGHPRRLQRVARILEDYGLRLQKSVFAARLEPKTLAKMTRRLQKAIDPLEDGVKIFHLCPACLAKRLEAGVRLPELSDRNWQIL